MPLMSFGIFGAVAAVTVRRIFGLFENCRTRPPGPLEVRVHVFYIDVKALRCLTEPFRILIFRTGAAHHDQVVAEFHRGVMDLAVGPPHWDAILPKTECFRQKLQCCGHILLIKIGCDGHNIRFCWCSLSCQDGDCPWPWMGAVETREKFMAASLGLPNLSARGAET
jgi:hypothetical protein